MERGGSSGSGGGYGIHFGDPLAPPQQYMPENGRDAPPTRMSGKSQMSQMSNASYGRSGPQATGHTYTDSAAGDDAMPPRRTLRRMYDDKSHYQQEEFLYGLERAPDHFKPEASTRNTIFHNGFYRGIVTGQDAIRRHHEQDRELRSEWRMEPRNQRLSDLNKHHFLREDPPVRGSGRRHYNEASNIVIRGPESVVPRGPNMEGNRMKGLLKEGLVIPPKESVKVRVQQQQQQQQR